MDRPHLDASLLNRILQRLSIGSAPNADLDGLRAVYSAWCDTIPFDNTAKLIALRTGAKGNLPGIEPVEFFERFLAHGAGGTCWPTSNALFALLDDLGFDARRVAGSMRDTGFIGHASVKVRIDGTDWLVDSSMQTHIPLPLTAEVFVSDDPVYGVEVERVDETHMIWWDLPPNATYIPCRLLVDDVSHDYYVERYEASRDRSPFNERVYVRRNFPGAMLVIHGNLRLWKTSTGVQASELTRSQLEESLRTEAGISSEMLDDLRKCGAIDASLQPSASPPPPAVTGPPPSKRHSAMEASR